MTNVQGEQASAKGHKMLKKIEELIHGDCQTIHEFADTAGISYGVCQEILTENLKMRRIAPSSIRSQEYYFEGDGSQN
jgi:hypothetical protein